MSDEPPIPREAQARSRKELGLASLAAVAVGLALLVTVVLPAEYGIDPTRMGRLLGLTDLADGGEAVDLGNFTSSIHRREDGPPRNDTFTFQIPGLFDKEYKLHLLANQSLLYTWSASTFVDYDFHGDPDHPSRPGEFASYETGYARGASGSFQAPFDGRHGWYFDNPSPDPVTITITTWGYYEVVGLLG